MVNTKAQYAAREKFIMEKTRSNFLKQKKEEFLAFLLWIFAALSVIFVIAPFIGMVYGAMTHEYGQIPFKIDYWESLKMGMTCIAVISLMGTLIILILGLIKDSIKDWLINNFNKAYEAAKKEVDKKDEQTI
jgi:ABC-type Fe3+ transport system permease subunit